MNPGVAKADAAKVSNAQRALRGIGKHWKLDFNQVMQKAAQSGTLGSQEEARKLADFIRQNGRNYGIKADPGQRHPSEGQKYWDDQEIESERQQAERKRKKDEEDEPIRRKKEEDDARFDRDSLSRWEGEGGATFESKLTRALTVLEHHINAAIKRHQ